MAARPDRKLIIKRAPVAGQHSSPNAPAGFVATKRRFGPLQCPARVSDAAHRIPVESVVAVMGDRESESMLGPAPMRLSAATGRYCCGNSGVRRGPTGRIGVSCVDCWERVPALDTRPEQVDVPLTVVWLARCGAPGCRGRVPICAVGGGVVPQDREFVIELDGQPGGYRVHVSSPAGDESVNVGFDPASLGVDLLEMLQARVLASAATSHSMRAGELERPLRGVGQALFEAVFQASAGALFLSSRNEVERTGGGCGSCCGCIPQSWRFCRGSCCSANTMAAIYAGVAPWCVTSPRPSRSAR